MSVKINHLKYKVTTRSNPDSNSWGNTEFVYLNLVFSVDDLNYKDTFLYQTQNFSKTKIILDVERFEKESKELMDYLLDHGTSKGLNQGENWVTGYQLQSPILQYLPKFDKFRFHEYFKWCGTTQGAINDLRLLQNGYNPTRTTDACFLDVILRALSNLWD